LNGYHWLIYAPLHMMRHDKQIAEVKATPGHAKQLPISHLPAGLGHYTGTPRRAMPA
jgi:hypothetical protein